MSRSKKGRAQGRREPKKSPQVELPIAELYAIVERARSAPLGEEDHAALKTAVGVLEPPRVRWTPPLCGRMSR